MSSLKTDQQSNKLNNVEEEKEVEAEPTHRDSMQGDSIFVEQKVEDTKDDFDQEQSKLTSPSRRFDEIEGHKRKMAFKNKLYDSVS